MNAEIFERACVEIETSYKGINTICKSLGSSAPAFYDFMEADKTNACTERYARAKTRQAEYLFDLQRETVFERSQDHTPFTGGNVIQRDRLISETLKWQAGKLRPEKYGDQIDITSKGKSIKSVDVGTLVKNFMSEGDSETETGA